MRELLKPTLNDEDQTRRTELEAVVPKVLATWAAGAHALIGALGELRERKLFRSTHDNFFAYCEDTFGITQKVARTILRHGEIMRELRLPSEAMTHAASTALALLPAPVKSETIKRVGRAAKERTARAQGKTTRRINIHDVEATAGTVSQILDARANTRNLAVEDDDPIPLVVRRNLARGDEFRALTKTLRAVRRKIEQLSRQSVGAYLLAGPLQADIKSAIRGIEYAIPGTVCTSCGGRAETCKRCKSRGWLSVGYEKALESQKGPETPCE